MGHQTLIFPATASGQSTVVEPTPASTVPEETTVPDRVCERGAHSRKDPIWASKRFLLPDPLDWHTRGRYFGIVLPPRPAVERAIRKGRAPQFRYVTARTIYNQMTYIVENYEAVLASGARPATVALAGTET